MAKNKEVSKKSEKMVSAKKLPGLFKKSYTEEDFKKKVLKKIYIPSDAKLVEKQFTKIKDKKGREVLALDKSLSLTVSDFTRCKMIAKDVKNQKFGVKFVPLLAVICIFAAIGITVTLFKNIVLERAICLSMQGIFGAKTDIEKVDLQIFAASLEVDGLEQANPDSPMKNIFQIDKIHVDFNLSDLLKGKFHAENIEVSGVALGTERKVSGEIIGNPKSKAEQAVEKEVTETSSGLKEQASDKLKAMFENYNPEKMLENIQNELKSPEIAKAVAAEVQAKVDKWQKVPAEYETSVKKLSSSVNELVKTDWSKINDPVRLKKALENINTAMTESDSLKKKIDSTSKSMKTDSSFVSENSDKLKNAIKNDTALVDSKIAEMKALFSVDGFKAIMQDAISSILYEKAGKFYPYINKAMNAALSSSSSKSSDNTEKKTKKAKKQKITHDRLAGRTIYYKNDRVPKLLIDNLKASGYEYKSDELLFEGSALDISSDQDMTGKPALIKANFKLMGNPNSADVTVDSRSDSKEPLVFAKYNGKGYPLDADAQVFALKSKTDINAILKADQDETFVLGGTLDLNLSEMQGMAFEPARVSSLYGNALAGIKKLTVGFNAGYDFEKGLVLEITNMDKLAGQLVTPVTNALTGEINSIAADSKNKVTALLSEKTGIASESISKFINIQGSVNDYMKQVNKLEGQLEAKKKEINKQLSGAATNAAKDAASSALKKLF